MKLIENKLMLISSINYKKIYLEIDKLVIEMNYENGGFLFDLSKYEDILYNKLFFTDDEILGNFYLDENLTKKIKLSDAIEMLISEDNKYNFILFKNSEGTTSLIIKFTDNYKKTLKEDSKQIINLLTPLEVTTSYCGKKENQYVLDFIVEDKNKNKVCLDSFIKNNIKDNILFNIEIMYKKRDDEENIYSFLINNQVDNRYVSNITDLCVNNDLEGIYDIYLRVVTYKNEHRIPIKVPNIQMGILHPEEIIIKKNNYTYYEIVMYYNEDTGISYKINKLDLEYKAMIQKVDVQKKLTSVIIQLDTNINELFDKSDIRSVTFEIRKRNSALNILINNLKFDGQIINAYIEHDLLLEKLNLGIWDAYVNITTTDETLSIRVKEYSNVENKKDTLILPYIDEQSINKFIKPYYTLDDDLSFEVSEKTEIKKVHYLRLIDKHLELKANLKVLNSIDIKNCDIQLYMVSSDLSRKLFKSTSNIKDLGGNDFILNIVTEDIDEINTINFKNNIYANKFIIVISNNDIKYTLNVTIDYSKIFIDPIDEKIQDNNYKMKTKLFYKIMCRVLPIKKGLVVFQSFGGRSYSGNPKYIYEYAKENNPSLSFVWALRNQFESIPGKAKKVKIESLLYYYYLSRAEYIISNLNMQDNVKKRKGMKFIQTWHGTPLKKISFDVDKRSPGYNAKFLKKFKKRVSKWDCLLSQNEYSTNSFRSAFRYKGPIYEVGHALNDILVENNSTKKKEIKNKLNIPKDKKVILYAPTWRDNSRYVLDIDIEKLNKELKEDYVLLIKTHYFVNTSFETDICNGFIYDVSKYEDIQELCLIADVLITDYSSVMFDFAVTKKPMIFYCHDLDYYKGKLRGFYFDFEQHAPGKIVKSTEEIIDVIKDINTISMQYTEKYNEFYNKFCYLEDGNSSRRAAASIFGLENRKKVYFLSFNVFGMGGTGRTVINTAKSLVDNGYNVELISVFGDENDQYFDIDSSIDITLLYDKKKKKKTRLERILKSRPSILINKDDEFYKSFSLLTDFLIIKKIISIKSGILVTTRPGFNIMIGKYFKFRRFAAIGQEHLNYYIHSEKLQKQVKKYYKNLDLILTLTDADTNGYIKEIPSIKHKIVKVPNAIPRLQSSNMVTKKKQIIAAGRLVPQKGFDLLIQAASEIVKENPDWIIKIYGKGRDNEYLKNLIIEYGVEKNVFLMGPSKEIEKHMAESEIYVLSSRYEGFGMVIVEAMEMGVPVVSFDCPEGPGEIITNEEDGILVDNGNVKELAKQVNRLISDSELREKLANNAKLNVRRYNSANITALWLEILNKI